MTDSLRVLVVEDDPDHAQLACEFLHVSGAFQVDVANDLQALWEKLAARSYDVITLDYSLPDGTGLEALTQLRARGYQLPVVMVTGRGDERVAAQAIQRGAVDYLVKTGDYLSMLPALIQKARRTHELMQAAQRSLDQIRYQALLLDNVHDAVVVWDLDSRLTFWNHAAESLLGWTAGERLGRPAQAHYFCQFTPPLAPPAGGAPLVDVERRGAHRTGREIWVNSSITPLQDADGRLIGYMDVSRDITQRKRLEAQVQAAQVQLVQAARLAAIGELASGVAHQISNPLTTIIGEAQLLTRQFSSDEPTRESVQAIEQAGWRAQQAVQRLLDFSRPASASFEALAVNDTIRNAVLLVGGLIEAMGVNLQVDLADSLPLVHANQRQLEDLWVNLLLQARDATDDGQPHHIQVRSLAGPAGDIQVEVSDDGRPIAPALLATVFEPDFTGAPHGRGSGLEFSLCREITRQHGGAISGASNPRQGTTFTVRLPRKG